MTTDDILMSFHLTEPTHTPDSLEQARQLLKDHEAWISIDLLAQQVDNLITETSIHFHLN